MPKGYIGIINASEDESDIRSLTTNRPIASIPFASRYRIIDFILSNMVNAGIRNVGIFAKSKSGSLVDHVEKGKPWDLDRKIDGLYMFHRGLADIMTNDSKMFRNNMEYIYRSREDSVILASSYMICNMDLNKVVAFGESTQAEGADIIVIYKPIANAAKDFMNCTTLNLDERGKLIGVSKNIGISKKANICSEMFIMKKEILIDLLYRNLQAGTGSSESGLGGGFNSTIYNNINKYNVVGYRFEGYMACINSIHAYYKANMEMLNHKITSELFRSGNIYTKIKDEPPTRYLKGSSVSNCLVADGCVIEGKVSGSLLSRYVKVGKGAQVKNCIILQGCQIGAGVKLTNVILDKNMELKGSYEFPLVIEKRGLVV